MPLLETLTKKGFISLICGNKAHSVNLHGGGIHPECPESIITLKIIHDLLPTSYQRVRVPATFQQNGQQRITTFAGTLDNGYLRSVPLPLEALVHQ